MLIACVRVNAGPEGTEFSESTLVLSVLVTKSVRVSHPGEVKKLAALVGVPQMLEGLYIARLSQV